MKKQTTAHQFQAGPAAVLGLVYVPPPSEIDTAYGSQYSTLMVALNQTLTLALFS